MIYPSYQVSVQDNNNAPTTKTEGRMTGLNLLDSLSIADHPGWERMLGQHIYPPTHGTHMRPIIPRAPAHLFQARRAPHHVGRAQCHDVIDSAARRGIGGVYR